MNLPNLITIGRILLVPVTVWLIISGAFALAFVAFLLAGISDGVDGYIARRFNQRTELGAYLDPIADKALLVSIYVALGIGDAIPRWLVILVVSRDLMIVGAMVLSWLLGNPMPVKPLMVSKLNTVAQVAFAALVLGSLGFGFTPMPFGDILMAVVAVLTLLSVSFYLVEWTRHMSSTETPL